MSPSSDSLALPQELKSSRLQHRRHHIHQFYPAIVRFSSESFSAEAASGSLISSGTWMVSS